MRKIFLRKIVLIPCINIKIDHIAGSIFWNVISFAVMICPSRVPSVPHMTLFFFLKGGLGLASQSHFLHDFWKKIFFTLYAIKWQNLIAWLPLLLEILGNMCIIITCFPVCDVINFEITFSFLISSHFPIWPKRQDNEKSF